MRRWAGLPDSMPVIAVVSAIFWNMAPPTNDPDSSDTPIHGA